MAGRGLGNRAGYIPMPEDLLYFWGTHRCAAPAQHPPPPLYLAFMVEGGGVHLTTFGGDQLPVVDLDQLTLVRDVAWCGGVHVDAGPTWRRSSRAVRGKRESGLC
jgi:hypothetical protein